VSHRTEQVESLLKRTISDVIARRLSDPRITGLVSITQVDISPDFAEATVYVSILPEQYERKSLAGLQHAAGHIGSLAGKAVALRRMPRLTFKLDSSLKKQAEIHREINAAMDEESARLAKQAGFQEDTAPADAPPGMDEKHPEQE